MEGWINDGLRDDCLSINKLITYHYPQCNGSIHIRMDEHPLFFTGDNYLSINKLITPRMYHYLDINTSTMDLYSFGRMNIHYFGSHG